MCAVRSNSTVRRAPPIQVFFLAPTDCGRSCVLVDDADRLVHTSLLSLCVCARLAKQLSCAGGSNRHIEAAVRAPKGRVMLLTWTHVAPGEEKGGT
jgi:hypothetical protein